MQANNILIKFQHALGRPGDKEPVALVSDFGCATHIDGTGRARFRGSRRSQIPEVAASAWAKEASASGQRRGPLSSVVSPPDVTTAADVWLLGSHVLPRLLEGVALASRLSKSGCSTLTTLLASTRAPDPAHRPTMGALEAGLMELCKGLQPAAEPH